MAKVNDLSRSLAALDQDTTLIAVVELSSKSWLVGATVPGIERHPLHRETARTCHFRRRPGRRGAVVPTVRSESKLAGAWVPAWSRSPAAQASGAGMT
jgi:transposase